MGSLDHFVSDLALITVSCAVITIIFKKIKLPAVLGYIAAGFLIGPNFDYLPTIIDPGNVNAWANIGIVFLMFALGLEFSFKKLATVGKSAIITAVTVMAAMVIVGTITGRSLGFGRMDSIFLGGMIAISSTMIILKSYEEYGLKQKSYASLVMGAMVVEDVGGIFMMIILSTMAVGKGVSGFELAVELSRLILFLILWLVLGIFLIPTLLRKTGKLMNNELLLITSLAICFAMVVISHMIGFSEALGAFMGGSIIAGTAKGEQIDNLVRPLKDLFGAVFFVSVGMLVDPGILIEYLVPILIITVVTIFGQMIFSTLGILFSGRSLKTAIGGGTSMVQIGEFSFIIAALGNTLGVTDKYLYPIIVCVAVITIATTPVFIKNSEAFYKLANRILPKKIKKVLDKYTTDDETKSERDSDWTRFLKRYFTRTLICSASMFGIYFFCRHVIDPFIATYMHGALDNVVMTIITCVLMLIPASLMIHRRNNIFVKLWVKRVTNRFALTLLRTGQLVLVAALFALAFRKYFNLPWWLLIIIGVAIIFAIARTDFFKSQAIRVEASFIANVNEKILHKRKQDKQSLRHWFSDRLFVAEFELTDPYDIPTVSDVYDNRLFDMRVIKIVRNGRHINIPKGHEKIEKGDVIQMIGSRDELDGYILSLEVDKNIRATDYPLVSMKDYLYGQVDRHVDPEDQIIFLAVPVESDSPFKWKTVKNSGFREKYKGFIVGIERNNYPMLDPSINTVIHEGDVLWTVGTGETGTMLLRDDMIHEE
ncbi:MAG: cation:proton antiporter [Anaerovoracaceae bacterium]|jgi:CPA2 family monovalent cation:H+ antiporter-2